MHSFFQLLLTLTLLALIAALIRPALTTKFIATPTRKKILIRLLPALFVIAALSGMTKPKTSEDSEAGTTEAGDAQAYAATGAYDERSILKQAASNAQGALQDAQRSGRISDPRCYMVAQMLQQDLSRSIADLGGDQTAASVLRNHTQSVRNACD